LGAITTTTTTTMRSFYQAPIEKDIEDDDDG